LFISLRTASYMQNRTPQFRLELGLGKQCHHHAIIFRVAIFGSSVMDDGS